MITCCKKTLNYDTSMEQILEMWRKHEGGTLTVPHLLPQGQRMDLLWLAFSVLLLFHAYNV